MKANSITARKWDTIKMLVCAVCHQYGQQLMRAIMFMAHAFPESQHPRAPEPRGTPRATMYHFYSGAKVNLQAEITRTCKSFTFDVTSVGNNCCGIIRPIAKFYVHIRD